MSATRTAQDAARDAVSAAVAAELARLHVTLSFASPSSHLYHEAATTVSARPPAGARLSARSNLHTSRPTGILQRRHDAGMNRLGAPLAVGAFGATTRAIVAAGGLDAATVRGVIRVVSGGPMNSTYRETFAPPPDGYVKRTSRR